MFLNQMRHAYQIGLVLTVLIAPMIISNYYGNFYANSGQTFRMSYVMDRVSIGNLMTQLELEKFVKKGYFLKDLQSTIVWEYV